VSVLAMGVLGAALLGAPAGCSGKAVDEDTAEPLGYPRLMVTSEHKAIILDRVDREPYASILAGVRETAALDYEQDEDPDVWDHDANGDNAEVAQANAFLAWLYGDEAAGDKARSFARQLESDFETNNTWDVNIRMPHTLVGYANTLDLLRGADMLPEDEMNALESKLGAITDAFYEQFVEEDVTRDLVLGVSQNNHPIRTAVAIGYAALVTPDHPDADEWLDWSLSELDYLWGEDGQYVQDDGGVSEGPHYYAFAFSPSVAFFIAMHNSRMDQRTYTRDCINRQDVDPWAGHGCVDGEDFTFENPLLTDSFRDTVDWSINLRLPSGLRPPLADSPFTRFNGGALLTSFGGDGRVAWDWANNTERPYDTSKGLDLAIHHLAYVDDAVAADEPGWRNRFLEDAGNAVFRSGWGADDIWMLLVAESGSARKTLHDHVDGTSFSLAAYGEYLLIDPGYYKPDELDNAVTAHSQSHNVILVDGQGAPDKGLLTDFGDADASLVNTRDGDRLAYAEAHQSYEGVDIERSVIFVDQRYFIVVDRLIGGSAGRDYTFRAHGWGGEDSDGAFTLGEYGARWERAAAGVDVFTQATGGTVDVGDPEFATKEAPHVHEFDMERTVGHHGVVDVTAAGDGAPYFVTVLAPYRVGATGADGPLTVELLDTDDPDAVGWLITGAGFTDVAVVRQPDSDDDYTLPSGQRLTVDGDFGFARLDGSMGVVIRGDAVILDGDEVADSDGDDFGMEE